MWRERSVRNGDHQGRQTGEKARRGDRTHPAVHLPFSTVSDDSKASRNDTERRTALLKRGNPPALTVMKEALSKTEGS